MIKKTIILFTNYFPPGFLGGGILRATANLTNFLIKYYKVIVVTKNKDFKTIKPYSMQDRMKISSQYNCSIYYLPFTLLGILKLISLSIHFKADLFHLNSCFSPMFTLVPLLLTKFKRIPVLLAPRGELISSALKIKSLKKNLFLRAAKLFRIYKNVNWHATSHEEIKSIELSNLGGRKIYYAPDLATIPIAYTPNCRLNKKVNEITILYLARIHKIKGLDRLLQLLNKVNGIIKLQIVGPEEDIEYAKKCHSIAQQLPNSITVEWIGPKPHEDVNNYFAQSHLYVLPTEGENHGYTIQEAIQNGCPVVTSDKTPWNKIMQYKAGWTIPLDDQQSWINAINKVVAMNETEYEELLDNLNEFNKCENNYKTNENYTLKMFNDIIDKTGK